MKLNVKKIIENNVITVDISVASLGSGSFTVEEEKILLEDFPRSIRFSEIDFSANVKIEDGDPVVTSEEVDDSSIVKVEIKNILDKEFPLNESLSIVMPFDVAKIPATEKNTLLDSVEKVGKAYAVVFAVKVQEEITKKLTEIRGLNTKFEGETEVIL